ncbi:unnamed protein product, partial [marine sediment metagenome]
IILLNATKMGRGVFILSTKPDFLFLDNRSE